MLTVGVISICACGTNSRNSWMFFLILSQSVPFLINSATSPSASRLAQICNLGNFFQYEIKSLSLYFKTLRLVVYVNSILS